MEISFIFLEKKRAIEFFEILKIFIFFLNLKH